MSPSFPSESRAVASLALLYVFRMLGLFMVIPVLFDYGEGYQQYSPQLLGLAMGIYGFSQALLQIPFGIWSDRWGRKQVITVGLILFAVGSVIAASSESVYGLILGRFLQGCGAISAAIMAMVADLTSDKNRTKAMAAIGASIGLSFMIAVVLGAKLAAATGGLSAIFWLTAVLALVGLLILWGVVPKGIAVVAASEPSQFAETEKSESVRGAERTRFKEVLRQPDLLRLNFGIFALHFVLIANFAALPNVFETISGLSADQHAWVYLGILVSSFIGMVPVMILSERKKRVKLAFVAAVIQLGLGQALLLALGSSFSGLLVAMFVFFMAFNYLEASLPSLISKIAPAQMRGTATGVYSSFQFFGMFVGGSCSGFLLDWGGASAVHGVSILLIALWVLVAFFMRAPQPLSKVMFPVKESKRDQLLPQLAAIPGVREVSYVESESAAFLRVDERLFQPESLLELEAQ